MSGQRSVTVAGVRSPVHTVGPDDADEAVVFVHGNPGAGSEWADLLARVGDFARAIAPDMPGFAGADKPRDFAYNVDGYARHLDGILGELGIRRAHLVMHDFGGPWSLTWAAGHLDRVGSVTLVNTALLIGYRWHRYARIWRTPVLGELFAYTASRPAFRFLVSRENPRLTGDQLDRLYDQSRAWGTRRAVLKLYRATPPDSLEPSIERLRDRDLPALVVWGPHDPYLPREQAERQRQPFPSARIEYLEDNSHWVFLEDPDGVASHIVPFLRAQLSARSGLAADDPSSASQTPGE